MWRNGASSIWGRASVVAAAWAAGSAAAQFGTAITYQGRLDANPPLTQSPQMSFALYDAPTGGNLLGTDNAGGVKLDDGLFTVQLNDQGEWGPSAFNGPRWVEVIVNGQALSPRQPLTAAPFALKVQGIDGYSLDAVDGSPINAVFVNENGFVGIGNVFPAFDLDVNGRGRFQQGDDSSAGFWLKQINSPSGNGNAFIGMSDDDHVGLYGESGGGWGLLMNRATGNVGIGNVFPAFDLDVNGRGRFQQGDGPSAGFWLKQINSPSGNGNAFIGMSDDEHVGLYGESGGGWGLLMNRATGNVGIKTANPASPLEIAGSTTITNGNLFMNHTSSPVFSLECTSAGGKDWRMTSTNASASGGAGQFWLWSPTVGHVLEAKPTGELALGVNSEIRVGPNGNVGVGTANPAAALHVLREPTLTEPTLALEGTSGSVIGFYPQGHAAGMKAYLGYYFSGGHFSITNSVPGGHIALNTTGGGRTLVNVLEIVGGADLAEPFNVLDEGIEPGMVVCIDSQNPGKLRLCRDAYDRTVAGVVSGANGVNTGMMLRQEGSIADGEHPVALSGRVYVWVDADAGGAIVPGDRLTTSGTPGHAMKASDEARCSGAVIGKAMTSLQSGKGLVLVLVNLQ